MNVVDASAVIKVLIRNLDGADLGEEELAAPHLIDSEVPNGLRNMVLRGDLNDRQAGAAIEGFVDLEIARFGGDWLRLRIWELRHNLTAYDATSVALAEAIGATQLFTVDRRLAAAPGVRCEITVV